MKKFSYGYDRDFIHFDPAHYWYLDVPKKASEPKKITLIEAEGPIETVEIKKVEDIIIR